MNFDQRKSKFELLGWVEGRSGIKDEDSPIRKWTGVESAEKRLYEP